MNKTTVVQFLNIVVMVGMLSVFFSTVTLVSVNNRVMAKKKDLQKVKKELYDIQEKNRAKRFQSEK
jgi:hypothetical protein